MQGLDESSTSVQRKRGGEDETEGFEELKRPRIMVEESELTKRIKKYLEENKSQKFIDIEKLTLSLHATYPDYGRRKQGVFKTQVLLFFRSQLYIALNKIIHCTWRSFFHDVFFIITSCKVAKAFNELKANLSSKKKNRSQGESQRKAVELSQEVCSKFINLNNACLLNLES